MFDTILALAADPSAEADLRHAVDEFVASVRASAGRGDRSQVARAEEAVAADPTGAFAFDSAGLGVLTAAGCSWQAGRFETPTIGELRARVPTRTIESPGGEARLWVLDGRSPATDIGSLQGTSNGGTLFQVASQFNCLESPSPEVVPVAEYFLDNTQGPRASISAFPGTLLRHYAAPAAGRGRFVQQTDGPQIDLLADVFEPERSPVINGYLLRPGGKGAEELVAALESNFEQIRVGVHEAVQVVLGYAWDGTVENTVQRRIAQVFTSTVAGGHYSGKSNLGSMFVPACRQTLRAAYLGTLQAAIALEQRVVVLTLIGGGVFGNPISLIWESILWAFDTVQPLASGPFDVVLNGFDLSRRFDLNEVVPDVRARGGAVLFFANEGLLEVRR